jgi:hypothetical protein
MWACKHVTACVMCLLAACVVQCICMKCVSAAAPESHAVTPCHMTPCGKVFAGVAAHTAGRHAHQQRSAQRAGIHANKQPGNEANTPVERRHLYAVNSNDLQSVEWQQQSPCTSAAVESAALVHHVLGVVGTLNPKTCTLHHVVWGVQF